MEQHVRIELAPDDLVGEDPPTLASSAHPLDDLERRQEAKAQVGREPGGALQIVQPVAAGGVPVHAASQPALQSSACRGFRRLG